MAKMFYTNLNLSGNQLQNAVIHTLENSPENPSIGQLYYNTTNKVMYQYDGNDWQIVGGSVVELESDVKKVVTSSSTTNGVTTLGTTSVSALVPSTAMSNTTTATTQSSTIKETINAIDTTLGNIKSGYVKKDSTFVDGEILISSKSSGAENADSAKSSGVQIETTLSNSSDTRIPTSKAVADYVGSMAGGITYKGTIGTSAGATISELPTASSSPRPKVGDAYIVVTEGIYSPLTETSYVGDIIICNASSSSNVAWTCVPTDFKVEDKQATVAIGGSSYTTIATIDGKNITMKVGSISSTSSGEGNVITDVSASGGTITATKGLTAVTTITGTANNGVVTDISQNGSTVTVTSTDLTTNMPDNKHYVSSVSQTKNGKLTINGATFDSSIPAENPSEDNAPTTSAVKTYVTGVVDGMDGSATIATVSDDVVTLKAGVSETNGVIANSSDSDIALAKVAKTGSAADVNSAALMGTDTTTTLVAAGDVHTQLQTVAQQIAAATAGSVTSFGGQTGVITVGNGLTMGTDTSAKEVSARVNGYIVNNAGTEGKALDIDSSKVDSNYTGSGTTNLATVATVTAALGSLDGSITNAPGADKTLTAFSETNGVVSATFGDISITHDKVSDWDSNVGVTEVAEGSTNGEILVTTNGTQSSVSVHGLGSAAYAETSAFEAAFTDGSHNVATITNDISGSDYKTTIKFFNGTQTGGALCTDLSAAGTLYVTETISTTNPLVTKSDLSGLVGAMVYKGTVNSNSDLPTASTPGVRAGWTYVVATAGIYDGKSCEVGDMIIVKSVDSSTITFNIINGENQVEDKGATIIAGAGTLTTLATVDGTAITAGVKVTAGSATIATVSDGVVTITPTVAQAANTGTIQAASGTAITLDKVATTGAAVDVSITDEYSYFTETTVEGALNELHNSITTASITIDGHKGAITTGDGLSDVSTDGGSFGVVTSGYITIDNDKKVALDSTKIDSNYYTVSGTTNLATVATVTAGINTLNQSTAQQAVTYTAPSASDGAKLVFNGITESNGIISAGTTTSAPELEFAMVATTGAAANVAITDSGSLITATNVEDALQELASGANTVKMWNVSSPAKSANVDWEITVNATSGWSALTNATVSIRNSSGEEVECDKVLHGNTIKLTFTKAITAGEFIAVITTKGAVTNVA